MEPASIDRYESAVEDGNGTASYYLALCYGYGIHRPEDHARATEFLRRAASRRLPEAQYTLAKSLLEGKWTDPDDTEGRIWLREAASGGLPVAMYELAQRYLSAKDGIAAAAWLYRAAKAGYVQSRKDIIQSIAADGLLPDDRSEVLEWTESLTRVEHFPKAHFVAGLIHAEAGESEKARRAFERAAEDGDAGAMFRLAQMYSLGVDVEADLEKALAWLRKAAELGDGHAQVLLAEVLFRGLYGQPVDEKAAENWIVKAEEDPSAEVLYLIGTYYRDVRSERGVATRLLRKSAGKGIFAAQIALIELLGANEQTKDEALSLGQILANEGSSEASLAYARLLLKYGNTQLHRRPAVAYVRPAAEQGLAGAQYELAIMHLQGKGGAARDPVEATRWLMVVVNDREARRSSPVEWAAAVYALAECYEAGRGVLKDAASAETLYQQAEKAGHKKSGR